MAKFPLDGWHQSGRANVAKMKTVSRLHQVASTKWFRPRDERGRLANFDYRHALDCLHGSWTCTGLSWHWRVFVLVSSIYSLFLVM